MTTNAGLRITIQNATFRRNLGVVSYPYTTGLEALNYLGGSVETSVRNHAPIGADGEEFGLIDVTRPYEYRVTGVDDTAIKLDFIDTTNDLTIVGVFNNASQIVTLLGNLNLSNSTNPNDGSVGFLLNNNGDASFLVSNGSASQIVSIPRINNQFIFWAGRVSGTEVSILQGNSGALTKSVGAGAFTRTRKAGAFHIGRGDVFETIEHPLRDFSVASTAVHKVAVPDAQLLRIYKWYRAYYAKRGISVI